MKLSLSTLQADARRLGDFRNQLRTALDRVKGAPADAQSWLNGLMQDEVFQHAPPDHIKRTLATKRTELQTKRRLAAGVALYHAEHRLLPLELGLKNLREESMRSPGPVDSFLQRSGGRRELLSDGAELQLQMLDEMRRSRFRVELADASPQAVRAAYARALNDDNDEGDSLARFVEARYSAGWPGATPVTEEQITEAKQLRQAIRAVQESRIPQELAAIESIIEETHQVVRRAQDRQLYGIAPANPDRDPMADEAYRAELEELVD